MKRIDLDSLGLSSLSAYEMEVIEGGSIWRFLGAAVGAVGGFLVGGPVGAMAGAAVGYTVGGLIDGDGTIIMM